MTTLLMTALAFGALMMIINLLMSEQEKKQYGRI